MSTANSSLASTNLKRPGDGSQMGLRSRRNAGKLPFIDDCCLPNAEV